MTVTDDDVKTRRQQKDKLEQLVSSSDDQKKEQELQSDSGEGEEEEEEGGKVETTTNNGSSPSPVAPPSVVRDGTMEVTAKVGRRQVFLMRWRCSQIYIFTLAHTLPHTRISICTFNYSWYFAVSVVCKCHVA